MFNINFLKIIADENFTVYIDHDSMNFTTGIPEICFYKASFPFGFVRIEEKIKSIAETMFEEMHIMSDINYNRAIVVSGIVEIIKRNMVIV